MRVLLLSAEYPPLVLGGLGRHVAALTRELAAQGHDVVVVTRGQEPAAQHETAAGLRVVRAAADPLAIDLTVESLLAWSQSLEHALIRAGLSAVRELATTGWHPDVVHAHDWLVAQSSLTLAQASGAPLVATIHATEAGRHQGWLPDPLNRAIHSVEAWLTGSADVVITCSAAMRAEVGRLFEVEAEVIPNGIAAADWRPTARRRQAARARFGADGPLLAFAGRLVHEKGVQTALDAVALLRRHHPGLRLVIAGTGPYAAELRAHARRRRLGSAVHWAGFVPDAELAALLGAADVTLVPSRYEPFGLVALEAAAAGSAVVVSRTGGLADLVGTGVAAAAVEPDDALALAAAITALLADPAARARGIRRAGRVVRRDYSWSTVAARTAAVYDRTRGRSTATRNSVTDAKNGPRSR